MGIFDILKSTEDKLREESTQNQKRLEYRRSVTNMSNEQLIMFAISLLMAYVGYNDEDSVVYEQLCKRSGLDIIYE